MEYGLLLVWYLLGDAAKGSGFVGFLVGNGILEVLRDANGPFLSLSLFSFLPF